MTTVDTFRAIRTWDGSKDRSFEELAFQLRELDPPGSKVTKTGNPDGGLEWYVELPDGELHGGQAKYYVDSDIDSLLTALRKSLGDALTNRPKLRKVTFAIPVDLPDEIDRSGRGRKSQRQKYEEAVARWRRDIPVPDDVEIVLETGGILLERLTQPRFRGVQTFWWSEELLDLNWCRTRLDMAIKASLSRYSPTVQVAVELNEVLDGLRSGQAWDERDWSELRRLASGAGDLRIQSPDLPTSVAKELATFTTISDMAADAMYVRASLVASLTKAEELLASEGRRQAKWSSTAWPIIDGALALLTSPRAIAAETRALFVYGEGGAGKSHALFLAAERALAQGMPAVVLLAIRFRGGHIWRGIESQLGLPPMSIEELLGAMEAAALAYGGRLLLVIDALNETDNSGLWASELPALRRALEDYPNVAIAVSVKDVYLDLVDPLGMRERDWYSLRHKGFSANLDEAVALYFAQHGITAPPDYSPPRAFSNPLFLKLYCLGLQDAGITEPPAGGEYETTVFERYLEGREGLICRRLRLDPAEHPVRSAVDALASEMARRGRPWILRGEARQIVDAYAPHLHDWPGTLFGSLHEDNIVVGEIAPQWESSTSVPEERVRFSYNRFSDYLIADAMVRAAAPAGTIQPAQLTQALRGTVPGLLSATATVAAERWGFELAELGDLDATLRTLLVPAVLESLRYRRPETIGDATRRFVEAALVDQQSADDAFGLVLQLAETESSFNAEWLHLFLLGLPMAERDRTWSVSTIGYDWEWPRGLDEIVDAARAAIRNPPSLTEERLIRISLVLAWTLSSPDGLLRALSTRLLAQLWTDRLRSVPGLLKRLGLVDDANVLAGVLVAAHGAVLRGGTSSPQDAHLVGEAVLALAAERAIVDDLARDAIDGIHEWTWRFAKSMVNSERARWSSDPPGDPGSVLELEEAYPHGRYGSLYFSLFGMGDFGNYVVEPRIRHFASAGLDSRPPKDRYTEAFDSDLASRWILRRVVELGWSPERFEEIDRRIPSPDSGRAHRRVERIGKKYQWIALRELLARLADNFHPAEAGTRPRPAEYFGRDLDPTFGPIEPDPSVDEDESAWWQPLTPAFVGGSDAAWAARVDNLLDMGSFVRPTDESGRAWVALARYGSWSAPHEKHERYRQEWQLLWTWLVKPADLDAVTGHLSERTLWGRWMPEEPEHVDGPYLGEMPWAHSARRDLRWTAPWSQADWPPGLQVTPAVESYLWESTIRDQTLREALTADVPAGPLYEAGHLIWEGHRAEWLRDGGVVAISRRAGRPWHDNRTALLVSEDWLRGVLKELDLSLVFGYLGGRQVIGGSFDEIRASPESSIDARATFASTWSVDNPILRIRRPNSERA